MKKCLATIVFAVIVLTSCSSVRMISSQQKWHYSQQPKNIIFMIVDGMGFEYVKAARIYNGQQNLAYEKFPCSSQVTTCAVDGADIDGVCVKDSPHITDSAAGATAMATGVKVKNGVVSKNSAYQHTDIESILEIAKRQGKSTGIIATKLFTDATPAAFVAHTEHRTMTEEILRDIFQGSLPNLILGADTPDHRQAARNSLAKYSMVHTADTLKSLADTIEQGNNCTNKDCPYVYGGFGQYEMIPGKFSLKTGLPLEITPAETFAEYKIPHLSQMTDAALKILKKNDNGFFLMVESSLTDMIGHNNKFIDASKESPSAIVALIQEMREMERTAKVLENFVQDNPDTLVVLTADHETGGLVIEEDKTQCLGSQGCIPSVRWTSANYDDNPKSVAQHTGVNVPLYAIGRGAEKFCRDMINNSDLKAMALGR
ncbi:MAG: alkaline phosphatase [Myxococcales bacterium]|nr:alkaline phosphatase [Myxococcales bacterium]USN50092.1 MAG: alkaline phosphatase [Myxococcales bacterium]